jgi:hypothetical protein
MATLDKGVTIRPASTSLLTIDSEDRFLNYDDERVLRSSPYDYQLANNKSLMTGFFTRLAVQQVVFPWTIPNVNRKTSKIGFSYDISGAGRVDDVIDLNQGQGFYTPVQLAARLQASIRFKALPNLSNFTMTYGINTVGAVQMNIPLFEYDSNDANVKVAFYPLPSNSAVYPFPNTTKQLFDVLGFTGAYNSVTGGATGNCVLVANRAVTGFISYAQAIRYIDIVSPDLVQCASLHDGTSLAVSRDSLCRLYLADIDSTNMKGVAMTDPLYAPPGTQPGTINYLPPIAKQIAWRANQNIGSTVKFQVFDDNGDLLTEASGLSYSDTTNWSMSLLVTEN